MKRIFIFLCFLLVASGVLSFRPVVSDSPYHRLYDGQMRALSLRLQELSTFIRTNDIADTQVRSAVVERIHECRIQMKICDLWLRYLDPAAQRLINGPLPVEWETEVFEKFEKPYRREGAGLLLAEQQISDYSGESKELLSLIDKAIIASEGYRHDSVLSRCADFDHFLYANRLHLLNLASIYTTGFECPDATRVIPELIAMMHSQMLVYTAFNESFPAQAFSSKYLSLYRDALDFVSRQSIDRDSFDHFTFIKDYVNPLYALNASFIRRTGAVSHSTLDYSIQNQALSIFDKHLYEGQSTAGVFNNVSDKVALRLLDRIGKSLFYDPILSGNGQRSCASCHKSEQFFTDTTLRTAEQFGRNGFLARNTPSLINAPYNHLSMVDGSHYTLQDQTLGVLTNPNEMNCSESELLQRVLSCKEYKDAFESLLPYTPQFSTIQLKHISSALTYYYGKFSNATSQFDRAMERQAQLEASVIKGFNVFMGKAQCATCHFVPQFNGVKPPFIGSEFEVLGTPADSRYTKLSADSGRYKVNPAPETLHAFRTGSLRNIARTAPYMHNGVFRTLDEVLDFYDFGGGVGHGLSVPNQTLSADSLHLNKEERLQLKAFLQSLDEEYKAEKAPSSLPETHDARFAARKVGGIY